MANFSDLHDHDEWLSSNYSNTTIFVSLKDIIRFYRVKLLIFTAEKALIAGIGFSLLQEQTIPIASSMTTEMYLTAASTITSFAKRELSLL